MSTKSLALCETIWDNEKQIGSAAHFLKLKLNSIQLFKNIFFGIHLLSWKTLLI